MSRAQKGLLILVVAFILGMLFMWVLMNVRLVFV